MMIIEKSDIIKAENLKYLDDKLKLLRQNTKDVRQLEEKTITLLSRLLIEHGKNKNSIRQISEISRVLCEALDVGEYYTVMLTESAKVYDIGNIAISSTIYAKDETLSFEEFEIVKNHTRFGYEILKLQGYAGTDLAALISLQHHEWWNGGGYPQQLKEEDIDISARIVAIADTVGALFHTRPGRKAWDFTKIIKYIKARNGLQYDPEIVKVFIDKKELIHTILQTDFSQESI